MTNHDGTGQRRRIKLFDENYYVTAPRATDGGIDFMPTVPRENDPAMSRERKTIKTICADSAMTREGVRDDSKDNQFNRISGTKRRNFWMDCRRNR